MILKIYIYKNYDHNYKVTKCHLWKVDNDGEDEGGQNEGGCVQSAGVSDVSEFFLSNIYLFNIFFPLEAIILIDSPV